MDTNKTPTKEVAAAAPKAPLPAVPAAHTREDAALELTREEILFVLQLLDQAPIAGRRFRLVAASVESKLARLANV